MGGVCTSVSVSVGTYQEVMVLQHNILCGYLTAVPPPADLASVVVWVAVVVSVAVATFHSVVLISVTL